MDKKDLYKEINRHLNSIDDSLKTLLWVQSAQLLINRKNMKKLSDTTSRMMSQLGSLSLNDDNSINDKNFFLINFYHKFILSMLEERYGDDK